MHQTTPGRRVAALALLVAAGAAALALAAAARPPADAEDHGARDVRHARGRPHPRGPPGLPARQPVEPGRLEAAGPPRLRRRSSRRSGPTRPSTTTSTWASSSCRPTRRGSPVKLARLPERVRPGAVPAARQRADRELAARRQREPEGAARSRARRSRTSSANGTGDRHVHRRRPGEREALRVLAEHGATDEGWQASNEATFDLQTGALRPERWTSSDAAGLPIFPAVVRYDECARGHGRARDALHGAPDAPRLRAARHALGEPAAATQSYPRMGERFRLKADFDISGFPPHVQAILEGPEEATACSWPTTAATGWMSIAPDRAPRGPRDAAPREGLGLRGGGHRRARGRGRAEVSRRR